MRNKQIKKVACVVSCKLGLKRKDSVAYEMGQRWFFAITWKIIEQREELFEGEIT